MVYFLEKPWNTVFPCFLRLSVGYDSFRVFLVERPRGLSESSRIARQANLTGLSLNLFSFGFLS